MAEVLWSDNLKKVVQELKQLETSEIEKKIQDDAYLSSKSLSEEEKTALQDLYKKSLSAQSADVPENTWV